MTIHLIRRHRRAAVAVVGLALAAALAGCSTDSKTASAGPQSGFDQRGAAAPEALTPGAGDAAVPGTTDGSGGHGAAKPPTTLPANAIQRSIIYNASITVKVPDVDAAADRVSALATGAGGYVGGDSRKIDGRDSSASVVLRVPADHFASTLDAVAALGTEADRQITTQDVTSQVIDVNSRIKTQQASVDRVRALLAKATTIGEVVSIESELTQRESDLESLEAQMASLSDLTSLSTITVTLVAPDVPIVVAGAKKPAAKGFVAGLKSGWHGFQSALTVVLTVLGAILPFVITIGVVLAIVRWVIRRRRPQRPFVAPAPAVPPAPLVAVGAPGARAEEDAPPLAP